MYHLLLYDLVENYLERRVPLREEHLGLAREAQSRGELWVAGAFGDPPEGAALVFTTDDPAVAERFAERDPYVRNGLVRSWRVRKWNVVIGGEAAKAG